MSGGVHIADKGRRVAGVGKPDAQAVPAGDHGAEQGPGRSIRFQIALGPVRQLEQDLPPAALYQVHKLAHVGDVHKSKHV